MKQDHRTRLRMRSAPWVWLCAPLLLASYSAVTGAPPREVFPIPVHTFDLQSPAVASGLAHADEVLRAVSDESLTTVFPSGGLGLGRLDDELNGMSIRYPGVAVDRTFVVLFSVGLDTVGQADADPALVADGVIYNVKDQAARGHAAGDLFMSTTLFTRSGQKQSRGLRALSNSTLAINNFDEGGRDFGGEPPNSANASTPGAPQDNVGATTQVGTNGTSNGFRALRDGQGRTPIVQVYYTLAEGSGSLPFLGSGNASPAHIIYDEDATIPGNEVIYAEASQLGLSPLGDDINALLVFDTVDPPDSFQPGDQVFFSLTPGSISIDGMSGGAATVFAVTAEQPVVPIADASQLGLGPVDDIDSLEFLFCDDAVDCAERFGLRYTEFDMDNDGHVNLADVPLFDSCFTGAGGVFTDPECNRGDGDGDGDVDCDDWDGFLAAWEGPGAPPKSDLCSGIPTVTEWGMVIMTLLMLIAGTLLIGRHRRAVRQA